MGAVMALCLLVLVFSFAAKLSLYQPKGTQIKTFASSKMWQHEAQQAAQVMSAPHELGEQSVVADLSAALAWAVTIFMIASLAAVGWLQGETSPPVRLREIISGLQLRAPPAR